MESARRPHYQVTFGVLAIGIGAFALLQSLVIPVLSTVQVELHTSQSAVTWVLTAYLLSASVMTPILGRVGDMIGKKWVFVTALGGPRGRIGAGGPGPQPRGDDRGPGDPGAGGRDAAAGVRDHPRRIPPGEGGRRRRHPRGR